jgi:hypothetical protein
MVLPATIRLRLLHIIQLSLRMLNTAKFALLVTRENILPLGKLRNNNAWVYQQSFTAQTTLRAMKRRRTVRGKKAGGRREVETTSSLVDTILHSVSMKRRARQVYCIKSTP